MDNAQRNPAFSLSLFRAGAGTPEKLLPNWLTGIHNPADVSPGFFSRC